MKEICKVSDGDFFTQTLLVGDVTQHSWAYCSKLCDDQKVLHIGCSDYPIFDKGTNMHLHLVNYAKELHGCDPNGVDKLREHYDGVYFSNIQEANSAYDVILVPNIIEHLENPGLLIDELFSINFKKMFVLVPNYKIYEQATYENGIFTEKIHPDHYFWPSPYTLWNLFRKNMEKFGATCELNFFESGQMISILIIKE